MYKLVNVDPETGIHYGVVSCRSLADWVMEGIFQNGKDLRYDSQLADAVTQIRDVVVDIVGVSDPDRLGQDVLDLIDELAETVLDHECDDCPTRYEDKQKGVVVQTMPDLNCLWVFKSPITRDVRECSPCVPNAGDLDSGEGPLKTYALPDEWLKGDGDR